MQPSDVFENYTESDNAAGRSEICSAKSATILSARNVWEFFIR